MHVKNLRKLILEVFKTLNSLNSSHLWDFLVKLPQTKTHAFGRHSVTFRGSVLWNPLSDDIKICENVATLKKKIRT